MAQIAITHDLLDAASLDAWVARRRGAIPLPSHSTKFGRLLRRKARGRTARTQRFFGEQFVASRRTHRQVHYSSAKWLTNGRFLREAKLKDPDHEALRVALHRAFGRSRLEALQNAAARLFEAHSKSLGGKRPTAADLWLTDRRGRHHFIEVKLPGDKIAPHQLAGLALLHTVLGRRHKVFVEIVHLADDSIRFKDLCKLVAKSG